MDKKILEWRDDKGSRGRPSTRWVDDLKRVVSDWMTAARETTGGGLCPAANKEADDDDDDDVSYFLKCRNKS